MHWNAKHCWHWLAVVICISGVNRNIGSDKLVCGDWQKGRKCLYIKPLTACLISYVCSAPIPMAGQLHVTASAKPCSCLLSTHQKKTKQVSAAAPCLFLFSSLYFLWFSSLYFLPWISFQWRHALQCESWTEETPYKVQKIAFLAAYSQMTTKKYMTDILDKPLPSARKIASNRSFIKVPCLLTITEITCCFDGGMILFVTLDGVEI